MREIEISYNGKSSEEFSRLAVYELKEPISPEFVLELVDCAVNDGFFDYSSYNQQNRVLASKKVIAVKIIVRKDIPETQEQFQSKVEQIVRWLRPVGFAYLNLSNNKTKRYKALSNIVYSSYNTDRAEFEVEFNCLPYVEEVTSTEVYMFDDILVTEDTHITGKGIKEVEVTSNSDSSYNVEYRGSVVCYPMIKLKNVLVARDTIRIGLNGNLIDLGGLESGYRYDIVIDCINKMVWLDGRDMTFECSILGEDFPKFEPLETPNQLHTKGFTGQVRLQYAERFIFGTHTS